MARDLDRLMEAYRRTSFQAETPVGHLAIRVGQGCPPLDALLALHGAEGWAFITACNPGSVRLSDAENGARMRALHGTIAARGLIAFDGQGVPDCDDWQPEPSLLVLGLPPDAALDIGRQFGQLAIVLGRRGEPARLVRCS